MEYVPFNVRAWHLRANVDSLYYFPRNVRRCLDIGRPSPEATVETLPFIRDETPDSTDQVEQGHGSGAVFGKVPRTILREQASRLLG